MENRTRRPDSPSSRRHARCLRDPSPARRAPSTARGRPECFGIAQTESLQTARRPPARGTHVGKGKSWLSCGHSSTPDRGVGSKATEANELTDSQNGATKSTEETEEEHRAD